MPSPFPGMDPYLEDPALSSEFHLGLMAAIRAELNRILPKGYIAGLHRHVGIDEPEEPSWLLDTRDGFACELVDRGASRRRGGTALAVPRSITLPVPDPKGKPYVKIVDQFNRRVISAIEMLSRANKTPGKDRDAYLAKRDEYLGSGVNLVELDFQRAGTRPPLGATRIAAGLYCVLVCRTWESPRAALWTFGVRDPIPPIPVPLKKGEEVIFSLRPCMDRAYDEARYGMEIDYRQPANPPLSEADETWARRLLTPRTSKKRG